MAERRHRSPAPIGLRGGHRRRSCVLDLVFSIDSIITAVGMTDHVPIMFVAVIAAVTVMLFAAAAAVALHQRRTPPSSCWRWAS